jgi:hypothetical protein
MAISNPGTPATKEQYFNTINRGTGTWAQLGNIAYYELGSTQFAKITGFIPWDFGTLVSIEVVCLISAADANTDIDLAADYGGDGEAYTTHSESDAASTYALAGGSAYNDVDISSVFSALSAGDYFGVTITMQTAKSLRIVGVKLRYD